MYRDLMKSFCTGIIIENWQRFIGLRSPVLLTYLQYLPPLISPGSCSLVGILRLCYYALT